MATPLYGGSFAAPKQEQSFAQKLGGALQGFSAGYQGKGQEFLANQQAQQQAQQQKIMGATIQDALELRKALEVNDTSTAMSLLDDRVSLLKNMGEDPSDTIALQNELMNGNARGVMGEVDQFISGAKRMGYLKPTPVDTKNIYQGQLLTQDPITGELISKPVNPNEDYIDPELKSMALRKSAENVIRLNAGVDEVTTSFNKVVGLEKEMRAGNRGAINAGIMNVARLISPGVVTDRDAQQLSGADTPIGLIYNTLQGKGVDMDALLRVYDPSNPETFDVDALMATAKNVTAAAIPSILSGYEDEKQAAIQFQAPNAYMRAYFDPESRRMKSMLEIQKLVQGANPESIADNNFFANSNDLFARAAAGELAPGKYEYPDPENPGSVIIVDYTGQ
jgi:hypothetical protein